MWIPDAVWSARRWVSAQMAFRRRLALEGMIPARGAARCMDQAGASDVCLSGRLSQMGVAIEGVERCASVWGCRRCSAIIRRRRADTIAEAASEWVRRGGRLVFVTSTVPHRESDDLAPLLDGVMASWRSVWSGRAAQDWKLDHGLEVVRACRRCAGSGAVHARRGCAVRVDAEVARAALLMGADVVAGAGTRSEVSVPLRPCPACGGTGSDGSPLVGQVRAIEVTDGVEGSSGWHPHVHALLFVDGDTTLADVLEFVRPRWRDAVSRELGRVPSDRWGVDVRWAHDGEGLADYLAKVDGGWGVAQELSRPDLKSRAGRLSMTQLLAKATREFPSMLATGEVSRSVLRWIEYERAVHGRRAMQWTPGFLAAIGLGVEVSDEDAAVDELVDDGSPSVTIRVPGNVWSRDVEAGTWHRHVIEVERRLLDGEWDHPPP